jgi:hypothetical protein
MKHKPPLRKPYPADVLVGDHRLRVAGFRIACHPNRGPRVWVLGKLTRFFTADHAHAAIDAMIYRGFVRGVEEDGTLIAGKWWLGKDEYDTVGALTVLERDEVLA